MTPYDISIGVQGTLEKRALSAIRRAVDEFCSEPGGSLALKVFPDLLSKPGIPSVHSTAAWTKAFHRVNLMLPCGC